MRNTLFPPLTPPRPSLAPPGERGEPLTAHLAACSKWMSSTPQATGRNAHCAGCGAPVDFKSAQSTHSRGWGIGGEIRYCAYGTGASSYLTHSIDFSPAATWALYPSPIQSAICPNARRRGYVPTLNTRPNGLFRLPFSPRRGVKRGGGDKGGQRDSRRAQPCKSQAQNHKAPAWASSIQ